MKRKLSVFLSLIMFFCFSADVFAADNAKINALIKDTAEYVYTSVTNPQIGSIGGEWAVLGLARSGEEIPGEYYQKYYENIGNYVRQKNGVLHEVKYTEYSRVILALTAIGKNPYDVEGYNLLTPLGDYEKTSVQGINGSVWALIALDSGGYEISDVREMYINNILENQLSDGGWALSGAESDADITAMALQALSKYRNRENVSKAVERAVECMSKKQLPNGGFSSQNTENSESCAQMLTALCTLGISPEDFRFVKNGNTILDNLMTYYVNGGFKHTSDGGINQMATEQCLCALGAVKRFEEGKNSLYDMKDAITISDNNQTAGLAGKNPDVVKKDIIFPQKTFDDIKNHKSRAAVEELASRGIINGKSDNLFEPDSTVTRAEFAAIVVRGLGLKENDNAVFYDILPSDWFFKYVNTAYVYGIVNGVSETEFNPNGTITREEAAVMTARAAKLCGMNTDMDIFTSRDILAGFLDYVKISDWAVSSVAFCCNMGIISKDDMEFRAKEFAKRAEIADMLYNTLKSARLL